MFSVGKSTYYEKAEFRLQLLRQAISQFRMAADASRPEPELNPVIDPADIIYQYSGRGHLVELHEPLKSAVFAGREFMDQVIHEAKRGAGLKANISTVKYLRGFLGENPRQPLTELDKFLFKHRSGMYVLRELRNLMKKDPERLEFGLGKDEFLVGALFRVPNDERDLPGLINKDLGESDEGFPLDFGAESFINWLEGFAEESMRIMQANRKSRSRDDIE